LSINAHANEFVEDSVDVHTLLRHNSPTDVTDSSTRWGLRGLSSSRGGGADDQEFYLLATSWQPEFCAGNYQHYPGCQDPLPFWRESLTIHGLWPQYEDGGWPSSCSTESLSKDTPEEVGMELMVTHWPNVKEDLGSSAYDSFWAHEWSKHGTCSGLDQVSYFGDTVRTLVSVAPTPPLVARSAGGQVDLPDLQQAYGGEGHVVLQCKGGYLAQVMVCLSRNAATGEPLSRVRCPDSVLEEGSCYHSVKIRAFEEEGEWKTQKRTRGNEEGNPEFVLDQGVEQPLALEDLRVQPLP